ncbi:MAG TPA: DUF2975 domain-containing protein [Sphingomonas sp.]|nr:DUF2975 domain-containing protein [Sphingomonas sp.]
MGNRTLEHLLSLGIGLVALGMAVGLVLFAAGLVSGEPLQTTLPLALDGAAHHAVTLRDTGQAAGTLVADHGTLTIRAGGPLYLLGQGLDIALGGGLLLLILYRLRRLVAAIGAGRPFEPDTVRSLRLVGWSLIGLGLWAWIRMLALPLLIIPQLEAGGGWQILPAIARAAPGMLAARVDAHLSVWQLIVGAIVLVLAEAFRHGQRLREDNEAIV